MKIRYNIMNINSMSAFASVRGRYTGENKDVYFIRIQGTNANTKGDILKAEEYLTKENENKNILYKRIIRMPQITDMSDADRYISFYEAVKEGKKKEDEIYPKCFYEAFDKTIKCYEKSRNMATETIIKNFAIKLKWWFDEIFKEEKKVWSEEKNIKIVADNIIKEQEFLFFYMITQMGADVLLLQTKADVDESKVKDVIMCSKDVYAGEFSDMEPLLYKKESNIAKKEEKKVETPVVRNVQKTEDKNKSYEELALLASSIVMIGVENEQGEVVSSGSGIMVGEEGFILTNFHVIRGGTSFRVRMEDDENIYRTDEIIKYNQALDLAIIRIQKKLKVIPVYNGEKELVRGQKVVAIGSPLGLFNSVSDGIISGFRKFDGVDIIQFTAPVSHGSSGGAVLNMNGEIIGVSTAVMCEGQNLNLAVTYKDINVFAKGFISET